MDSYPIQASCTRFCKLESSVRRFIEAGNRISTVQYTASQSALGPATFSLFIAHHHKFLQNTASDVLQSGLARGLQIKDGHHARIVGSLPAHRAETPSP